MGTSFDKLTERERVILRLVLTRRNSSEIGRATGDTPSTVDALIKRARDKLGAPDRLAAARMLERHEMDQTLPLAPPPVLVLPTQELSAAPAFAFSLPVQTAGRRRNDLTTTQRIGWAVAIAIAAPVLLIAMAALLEAASHLFANIP